MTYGTPLLRATRHPIRSFHGALQKALITLFLHLHRHRMLTHALFFGKFLPRLSLSTDLRLPALYMMATGLSPMYAVTVSYRSIRGK